MSSRVQQARFKKWRAEHRLSPDTLADWITMTFEMLQAEDMLKIKVEDAVKPTTEQMQDAIAQLFPSGKEDKLDEALAGILDQVTALVISDIESPVVQDQMKQMPTVLATGTRRLEKSSSASAGPSRSAPSSMFVITMCIPEPTVLTLQKIHDLVLKEAHIFDPEVVLEQATFDSVDRWRYSFKIHTKDDFASDLIDLLSMHYQSGKAFTLLSYDQKSWLALRHSGVSWVQTFIMSVHVDDAKHMRFPEDPIDLLRDLCFEVYWGDELKMKNFVVEIGKEHTQNKIFKRLTITLPDSMDFSLIQKTLHQLKIVVMDQNALDNKERKAIERIRSIRDKEDINTGRVLASMPGPQAAEALLDTMKYRFRPHLRPSNQKQ